MKDEKNEKQNQDLECTMKIQSSEEEILNAEEVENLEGGVGVISQQQPSTSFLGGGVCCNDTTNLGGR